MPLLRPSRETSPTELLRLVLDAPSLVKEIRSLAPLEMVRLIEQVGLEDAGEIVALATAEQLVRVLDSDLWTSSSPGLDEDFDEKRFLLWLEILLEAGEDATARRLAELPEDLVFLAFYKHILVLNLDDMSEQMSSRQDDDDLVEKALESCLCHELDEYCVVARRETGWDSIVTALVALYDKQPDLLSRLLSRCCYASSEYIEDEGGLYNVLTAEEMLAVDAAADRSDRRAKEGYVAPSDARAFLKLAKGTAPADIIGEDRTDPVTRAYFREASPGAGTSSNRGAGAARKSERKKARPEIKRLGALLGGTSGVDAPSQALISGRDAPDTASSRLRNALAALGETDPTVFDERTRELAYLANLLVAGHNTAEQTVRPIDAVNAAVEITGCGLDRIMEHRQRQKKRASPLEELAKTSAVKLFRLGWRTTPREELSKLIGVKDVI